MQAQSEAASLHAAKCRATWRHGDMATWQHGSTATRRHGDAARCGGNGMAGRRCSAAVQRAAEPWDGKGSTRGCDGGDATDETRCRSSAVDG